MIISLFVIPSQAHIGVKGVIDDAITGIPIVGATIKVRNITDTEHPQVISHGIKSGESYFVM